MSFVSKYFGKSILAEAKSLQVPKNANPPAPPNAGPKLASAVFRDCEIRGRKTIEARFDNGDTMQFIRETPASPTWVTYPMMVTLDPKMVNKLNDIERYLKTWGGPYPTAHESQVKPKGLARVGEEGPEIVVQPDGKMKIAPKGVNSGAAIVGLTPGTANILNNLQAAEALRTMGNTSDRKKQSL